MEETNYSKRPIWQWVIIYLVIGIAVYGIVYYFVLSKKGGNSYTGESSPQTQNSYQQENTNEPTPTAANAVEISNFKFSPPTLTVKVGDKVTWTNRDSVGHTATADDGSFDTGILDQGKSGTVTFDKAGTFGYYCVPHPKMRGTIIVQ